MCKTIQESIRNSRNMLLTLPARIPFDSELIIIYLWNYSIKWSSMLVENVHDPDPPSDPFTSAYKWVILL